MFDVPRERMSFSDRGVRSGSSDIASQVMQAIDYAIKATVHLIAQTSCACHES